jgi:filamentous hemagglutinin family protein
MKVTANLFRKLNLIKVGQPTRRIFVVGKACITSLLFATSVFAVFLQTAAKAQITPVTNDADTVVNQNGNTLNIEGGTKAGANLLHSFEKFGVNKGQTANFLSNPSIQNILGRVTGGDASVINGLIQVTGGNSNLYLMNPAGIIFGSGASLNVPASFTATTANGIGLGDKWFNALGTNDYANLLGNPGAFAFTQSGAIFNAGNLAVASGQNLTLLGGTVVNTGTISAPSGNITIAAVPEEKLVRVTQAGSLLSLGLPVETKAAINPQPFTPLSLPQLLTGGNLSGATGVTVENGVVKLTGSGVTIANTSGTAVVSNKIDVSGATGGTVNVLGDKVGLVSANINASGTNGGGTVLVSGIRLTASGDISLTDTLLQSFGGDNGELQLNAVGGNLTLENTSLEAPKDVRLQAQSITVRGSGGSSSSLKAGQDLILQAQANPSTLTVENTELQAGQNLKLTAAQGNMALQNVTVAGQSFLGDTDIRLESQSLSINNSQLQAAKDLNALVQTDLTVDNSKLRAYRDLTLQTQNNLNLKASEVAAGQNLQLQAQGASGKVRVEDVTGQAIARSGKDITISGTQAIDIKALNNPQSVFHSGGNFTFISNGAVTANGRFISGGNFAVCNLANNPGDFRYTPVSSNGIISAGGDISFDKYTGTSLKVEAGGSITGEDIEITGANTTLSGTDSDIAILSSNPSLILRAGLSELRQTPNVLPSETELRNSPNIPASPLGGATFTDRGRPSSNGIIVGNISINDTPKNGADAMILSAPGGITIGAIRPNGGSVKLTSTDGNITIDTIRNGRASGGGGVDISTNGIFRATGSFDFTFELGGSGSQTTVKTSIQTNIGTGTQGVGLDGINLPASITIRQGGASFVKNYDPGLLPNNAGGTAGEILIAAGSNSSVVSSNQARILIDSLGTYKPDTGTGTATGTGTVTGTGTATGTGTVTGTGTATGTGTVTGTGTATASLSPEQQQAAQRQVNSQTNSSACNSSNTVAVALQPTDSRTGDTSNQTVSSPPAAASNNCTPANNDQQILKILDATPDSNQNKELYFDSSYPRLGEFARAATFKN